MPEDLVNAIVRAKDDEAVNQIGIEWAIAQSRELKAYGVPCLHYYTMGENETIKKIVSAVQ
jgi:methylenetetrahydrofolate reductase (NADPH)